MNAGDFINSALRLIGALESGEVPEPEESADALVILNQMMDEWNAERLAIFTVARQVFTLVAGQQAYQMGSGAPDFNVPRPPKIERAGIISLNNPAQPLELPIGYVSDKEWAGVPVKNIQSALPYEVWDDGGFPFRTLNYWPIPNVQVQATLYTWQALTQFPDLVTDETFPPGYPKAIRYNLAVDLAPEFGMSLAPEVAAQAVSSKAKIKSINVPPITMSCDAPVGNSSGQYYNWLTDNNG